MKATITSPFPIEALPRIWSWIQPFKNRVSDDFSPQTLADFVSAMESKWDSQKTWAVYAEGELGGLIVFERINPWLGTAHIVFKPEFQGKGLAVRASREAAAEMFKTGIGKLIFYPLGTNPAIGSLIRLLGGKHEGVLRQHTLVDGKPTDVQMFGLTRIQYEERLHASRNSGSDADFKRNRSGIVNSGVGPVGEGKEHPDQPANPVPGDAGASTKAA